jgi:hypothetical protein
VLNGTASPVLSAAPYRWSTGLIGSAYVTPLIGAAFAALWSCVAADKLTIYLTRRNKGVREREHRLWPLAISGISRPHQGCRCALRRIHWIGLEFGLGMLAFGCMFSCHLVQRGLLQRALRRVYDLSHNHSQHNWIWNQLCNNPLGRRTGTEGLFCHSWYGVICLHRQLPAYHLLWKGTTTTIKR